MTDSQRQQCQGLMQRIRDAGLFLSLHEFRSVTGYRVAVGDGQARRIQRDGEDPVALLEEMCRLFGLNKSPQPSTSANEPPSPDP